jgi:hypothetical protein
MSSGRESALRRLTEMDAQLQTTVPIPLSMSPARTRATSLHAIGEALLTDDLDPSLMQAFADGLCLMVVTKVDQFPENMGFFTQPPNGVYSRVLRARCTWEFPAWTKSKWPHVHEIASIYTVQAPTSLSTML